MARSSGIHLRPFRPAWRWYGLIAWIALIVTGCFPLIYAIKPLVRTERIVFGGESVWIGQTTIAQTRVMTFRYRDIGEFRNRKDPNGLIESELILLLNRPMLEGGIDEVALGLSTTESEKAWLASVLNGLLAKFGTKP
jgi:hypothetical protein